jgi:curved DNA-binding protein CbpA
MAKNVTLYDILGISAGAAADTLRRAYEARVAQLRPELINGAPSPVIAAVSRAKEAVDMANLVLGAPESRLRYDRQLGLRKSGGLRETSLPADDDAGPLLAAALLMEGDLADSFGALISWLSPGPSPARRVKVPDLRGLFYRSSHVVAAQAGFRLAVVRLTAHPMPVEGLVTGQSPEPGTTARRQSALTVQVWHPAKRG